MPFTVFPLGTSPTVNILASSLYFLPQSILFRDCPPCSGLSANEARMCSGPLRRLKDLCAEEPPRPQPTLQGSLQTTQEPEPRILPAGWEANRKRIHFLTQGCHMQTSLQKTSLGNLVSLMYGGKSLRGGLVNKVLAL